MWIRTQGKSCLIKCNIINVEIGEQSDDYLIRTLLDNGRTFILACYKSEERALEVLDEIQSYLENNYLSINDMPQHNNGIIANGTVLFSNSAQKIYQMPKE